MSTATIRILAVLGFSLSLLVLFRVSPDVIGESADFAARSRPVIATVTVNEFVETLKDGRKGCQRRFEYSFEDGGETITSTRFLLPKRGWDCAALRSFQAKHPVGSTLRAQRLLDDTQPGYVIQERPLLSPLTLAIPFAIIVTSVGAAFLLPHVYGAPRTPTRAGRWYVLRATGSLALRSRTLVPGAIAYLAGWAISLWLDAQHWGFSWSSVLGQAGWLHLGAGFAATSIAVGRLRQLVHDPVVAVDRWPLVRGESFTTRIAVPMRQLVALEYTSIGIACRAMWESKNGPPSIQTIHNTPLGAVQPEEATADDAYRFTATITVPKGEFPPSGAQYGRYRWFVVLHLDPDGGPGADIEYPVDVA